MSGLCNFNFSQVRAASPHIRTILVVDRQYLSKLLAEHQKLEPFMQVFPVCTHLLNQEILRVSRMLSNQGFDVFYKLRHRRPSPMASSNLMSSVAGTRLGGWNSLQQERLHGTPGMTMDWQVTLASSSSHTVKRILRLEIPVDTYPNEEKLRGRPGFEHLNEPLHILIEADLSANIVDIRLREAQEVIEELLKPVDESEDYIKRQQLRELAMLNSNFKEESPRLSGSVSPSNSGGMKQAKTNR